MRGFDFSALNENLRWLADYIPPILLLVLLIAALYVVRSMLVRSIEDTSRRYHVRKAINFIGYFLIAVLVLSTMNARLAQFTVIIGAVGAGVAFALQEVIGSIAGWFAISFGNFYKPGDRVQLGGIKGDVIDIGVLRTTLMEIGGWVNGDQYNGRVVRVANSFVFKEPVYNYSGEFPFLWDEFKLPVRYGSDWRLAEELIRSAVEGHVSDFTQRSQEEWDRLVQHFLIEPARLEPQVTLVATDNWIEFTVRYLVDFKKRRATRDAIMRSILDSLDGTKGKVQLGSATFELVGLPKVQLSDRQ